MNSYRYKLDPSDGKTYTSPFDNLGNPFPRVRIEVVKMIGARGHNLTTRIERIYVLDSKAIDEDGEFYIYKLAEENILK